MAETLLDRFINLFRSRCTAGLLPRAAGRSAVVLTAVMAAGCGSTPADPVADPFPAPLPPAAGVTVSIAEFASLPDLDGQPAQMMHLVDEPGTQRLFVNDMRGPLYSISYDGRTVLPYLDLGSPRWALALYIDSTNRGFRSFAFHPQFNTPGSPGYGKFYILADTHNASPSGQGATNSDGLRYSILLEWSAQDPTAVLYDGGPPREMMRYRAADGGLAFNPLARPEDPDYGLLYFTISDTRGTAQDLGEVHGKMLRIDPFGTDSANGQYGIPADNPFAGDGDPNTLGEIYAYGLRNPQRFSWDTDNGRLFVADIGKDTVEEINLVTPGANFGWNDWEGSFKTVISDDGLFGITLDNPRSDPAVTYPFVEYDHVDELFQDDFTAITGVVAYRHDAVPQLENLLLFGDMASGEVFYVQADALPANGGPEAIRRVLFNHQGRTKTLLELIWEKNREQDAARLAERANSRFGVGPGGMLLLLNKGDGTIRRLTRP